MNALQAATQRYSDAQDEPCQEPEPVTLFSQYATEEEIAEVRASYEQIDIAEGDVRHIQTVLGAVMKKSEDARRRKVDFSRRAAAIALGETVQDEPVQGETLLSLEDQLTGLRHRLRDAEEMVSAVRGKFRGMVNALLRTCAERCAQDYYEATQRQGWCWQQLALAQGLVGSTTRPLVDEAVWTRYLVPGSPHLPALKSKCREENFMSVLMSYDRLTLSARDTLRMLREHGRQIFGEFPL